MGNFVTQQSNQEEVYEELLGLYEEAPSQSAGSLPAQKIPGIGTASRLPTYQPTPLAIVNRTLAIVDDLTGGRAGWVQRFVTYLCIGGFAALVNLAIFFLVFYRIKLPVNISVHNLIASVLAAEISIMANFIPNDYFTFRHLAGHVRSWYARCTRFHLTSIVGSFLTLLIEFSLTSVLHVFAILAQAIALILVLVYNFSFHHIFTYRHVKSTAEK